MADEPDGEVVAAVEVELVSTRLMLRTVGGYRAVAARV